MIKFDVGNGKVVEIPEKEFPKLLSTLVRAYVNLAEGCIRNNISGLAYFDSDYLEKSMSALQVQYISIDAAIQDVQLLEALHSLRSYLQQLREIDQRIINEYANFFNMRRTERGINRKKLKTMVERNLHERLPPTVLALAREAESLDPAIQQLKYVIENRISELFGV